MITMKGRAWHTYETRGATYQTDATGLIADVAPNDVADLLASGCQHAPEPETQAEESA